MFTSGTGVTYLCDQLVELYVHYRDILVTGQQWKTDIAFTDYDMISVSPPDEKAAIRARKACFTPGGTDSASHPSRLRKAKVSLNQARYSKEQHGSH